MQPLFLNRRTLIQTAGLTSLVAAVGIPTPSYAAANSSSLLSTGLYAWPVDYLANRPNIKTLNSTVIRLANDTMSDQTWTAVKEDALDAHITISGTDRSQFSTESAWISDYLNRVDTILSKWPFPAVEIWNEPNFGMWSNASPTDKQKAYGNLLVAAYQHIKQRYPGTLIIGFGAGGSSAAAPGFIKGVLQQVPAAKNAFDVCSLHPYIDPTAPEAVRTEAWGTWTIESTVKSIRDAGVTKPLWFTEIGWQVSHSDGGKYSPDVSHTVSPSLQAAYMVRVYMLCLKLGIQRVTHMYVTDTDNYNAGFFTSTGPRPQAVAMKTLHQKIQNPTNLKIVSDGSNNIYDYIVTATNATTRVVWAPSGNRTVTVSDGSTVVDTYGSVITARPVPLSDAPVYITGASATVVPPSESTPPETPTPVPVTPSVHHGKHHHKKHHRKHRHRHKNKNK